MRPGSRGNINSGGRGGIRGGVTAPGGRRSIAGPGSRGGRGNAGPGGSRGGRGNAGPGGGRGGRGNAGPGGGRGNQIAGSGRRGGPGGNSSYYRGGNRSGNRGGYNRGRGGYGKGRYGRGGYGWRGYGYGRRGYGRYGYGRRGYYGYYGNWLFGFWGLPWYSRGYGYGGGYGYGYPYYSAYTDWGYPSYYSNPYYVAVDNSVVDYSQLLAEPAEESASDAGLQSFDDARAAFKQGDYTRAMQLVDSALVTMPLDSVLHEFRALILFAQGNYEEAASVLHPVLSAGPGWNWSTLLGLYTNVDVYTQQLRALEKYRNDHKQSALVRFLLGYQYLTCGHNTAAADEFAKAVALQPDDQLSRNLYQQLTGENLPAATKDPAPVANDDAPGEFTKPIVVPPGDAEEPEVKQPPTPPAAEEFKPQSPTAEEQPSDKQPMLEAPADAQPQAPQSDDAQPDASQPDATEEPKPEQPAADAPDESTPATKEDQPDPAVPQAAPKADLKKYVGTWKSVSEDNMKFELTLTDKGTFTWVYTAKGETHKFSGEYVIGNGLLTLARPDHNALVGRLKWVDDKSFNFKIVGGGDEDSGLTFKK
ncbi:Tetratricopeptide repeat protein [Symmachiella macrocystis]|uniref:Tetratricopeptide repeat protein n=1 Tax=Symmachiella macrocystis TaxID=2527985 RepID=A0A5C6BIZ6_9PLAN|nr:hypothetical protein [Symmachiella macrocystis]TWU11316.1 Tetratricopeptide repeat protein [Symmachiella macrocystis]